MFASQNTLESTQNGTPANIDYNMKYNMSNPCRPAWYQQKNKANCSSICIMSSNSLCLIVLEWSCYSLWVNVINYEIKTCTSHTINTRIENSGLNPQYVPVT